jgi:hypothetical protein
MLVSYWATLPMACLKHASSKSSTKLNASQKFTNFRVMTMLPNLILSSFFLLQILKMQPNFSSMAFNSLANPCPIISLASKRPIITSWNFQSTNIKCVTGTKVSCCPLLIHKSNNIGWHQVEVAHANSTNKLPWYEWSFQIM